MAEPTKADQAAATEIARWFWGDDGSLEVSEDEMLPIAAIIAKHMAAERQELEEANECVWRLFEDLRDELKQREAAARKALEETTK